ncbi:holin-like protein [Pustulibacterium marinum]|uniref:Holin-like protein n=1 Tax=Pustulibacterium marinum TaxID=1224947 RepID=A0A1I7GVR4_9FLAO|nr:CidA/LrgA family protein [Pustulibacterium marinum]SFU52511.1 holin-like protein [Pustulibacterium marinum]
MIKQVFIIFGCLSLGKIFVAVTGLPLPASIVGMLILTALLMSGKVKITDVKDVSDFFNKNMAFFFVPAGVAIMLYLDVISASFWPILVAAFVSTTLVLLVTGWTHQRLRKRKK